MACHYAEEGQKSLLPGKPLKGREACMLVNVPPCTWVCLCLSLQEEEDIIPFSSRYQLVPSLQATLL